MKQRNLSNSMDQQTKGWKKVTAFLEEKMHR